MHNFGWKTADTGQLGGPSCRCKRNKIDNNSLCGDVFGRCRRRSQDDIKMTLQEVGWDGMD